MSEQSKRKTAPKSVPNSTAKTDPMAVWSMTLGILSYFCCGFFSAIPAIILGHISMNNIGKSKGGLEGKGMALAGLILGYIAIGLMILGIIIYFVIIAAFGADIFKNLGTHFS